MNRAVLGHDPLEDRRVREHAEEIAQLAAGDHDQPETGAAGAVEGVERWLIDEAVVGDGAVVVGCQRREFHRRPGQPSTLSGGAHAAHDRFGDHVGGQRAERRERDIRSRESAGGDRKQLIAVAGRVIRTDGARRPRSWPSSRAWSARSSSASTFVATTASVVLRSAWSSSAGPGRFSVSAARITSTLSAIVPFARRAPAMMRPGLPVEHVPGRVHDGECANHDVADLEARSPESSLHAAQPAAAVHLPHRRPGSSADVAFGDRTGGRGRARLVCRVRIRPDPRIRRPRDRRSPRSRRSGSADRVCPSRTRPFAPRGTSGRRHRPGSRRCRRPSDTARECARPG